MSDTAERQGRLLVNGVALQADVSGALIWHDRRLAVVADLHFEKATAFAQRGQFLPPYDTAATLDKLETVIARHGVEQVICLGDSFHDGEAAGRLDPAQAARIRGLTARLAWTWIAGNHDPAPPADWGGAVAEEITLGALTFRHEAVAESRGGEISGHYHPKAAVVVRGRRISAPCFVTDGRRLILPAFGAFTGGLSVLDPAIAALFKKGFRATLLGRNGLFAFPKHALV
ncbi:ligase-associated DNA damage response endonuclease PdeM [Pelagibius sp. 7325]|uniref:ligase-associated DNA damage response endonuclease PdeM n=1 Tax=Pelagibius sp. 7325 TaxID=3131994 RepID=UPI0030EF16CE